MGSPSDVHDFNEYSQDAPIHDVDNGYAGRDYVILAPLNQPIVSWIVNDTSL